MKTSVQLQVSVRTSVFTQLYNSYTMTATTFLCWKKRKVRRVRNYSLWVYNRFKFILCGEKGSCTNSSPQDTTVDAPVMYKKCARWEQRKEQEHSIICTLNNARSTARLHSNRTAKLCPESTGTAPDEMTTCFTLHWNVMRLKIKIHSFSVCNSVSIFKNKHTTKPC